MFQRLAIDRGAILFDADRVARPGAQLFDSDHWRELGALTERAGGRGSIDFIEDNGRHWVMRRYLRGGMAVMVAHDHFLFLGEERTRSFRELRLLGALRQRGLPVPTPVAACYCRGILTYTAALITERLADVRSLSETLAAGGMDDARWSAVGRCLRRFHDAGVQHADLNSDNIMLDMKVDVWVLDFDRGTLREPGPWQQRVLDRLERSIVKRIGSGGAWRAGFALLRRAHDG